MARRARGGAAIVARAALCALAPLACGSSGAEPDREFDTAVPVPAYAQNGPLVLYDEAHRNIHRISRTYGPFAELLRNDGYVVERGRRSFDAGIAENVDVLVIANALGANDRNDDHAMTDAEADSVVAWVRRGGSLLLVTDHYPTGAAVQNLAARLGVDMSEGVTEDSVRHDPRFDPSHIVFDSFPAHPATRGLGRVLTFTGQSLGVPAGAVALLPLRQSARDRAPAPRIERDGGDVRVHVEYGPAVPAGGRAQAVALELGHGRVVVLGEAAMISAQLSAYDGSPFGMNVDGYDNRTFLLNIVHWLSGHG